MQWVGFYSKQGQKCPLDKPKRMIERREKDRRRDIEREGEIERGREKEVKGIERYNSFTKLKKKKF